MQLHSIYARGRRRSLLGSHPLAQLFQEFLRGTLFFPPAPSSGSVAGRVTNLEKYRCDPLPVIPRRKP
jgi:hypothetical protein